MTDDTPTIKDPAEKKSRQHARTDSTQRPEHQRRLRGRRATPDPSAPHNGGSWQDAPPWHPPRLPQRQDKPDTRQDKQDS
jgi:hypothetical protein